MEEIFPGEEVEGYQQRHTCNFRAVRTTKVYCPESRILGILMPRGGAGGGSCGPGEGGGIPRVLSSKGRDTYSVNTELGWGNSDGASWLGVEGLGLAIETMFSSNLYSLCSREVEEDSQEIVLWSTAEDVEIIEDCSLARALH